MIPGATVTIIKDTYNGKKKLIAKAGEPVTIITTTHSPVIIVEKSTRERFAIHLQNIK